MSRNGKVVVAMSGGVDSSVAACLLKEQGYDCVGVFMRVGAKAAEAEAESCRIESKSPTGASDSPAAALIAPPRRLRHGCCSATDAMDARAIAGKLGIPFYALNFEPDFQGIIDYFVSEYGRARTPNPCVECNIRLKFGKLLRYADLIDAEFVATGHYARTRRRDDGSAELLRGVNLAKDQSYVLFGIRRDDLRRCLFPIGEIPDKAIVRQLAGELGLRVHDKPDSQEICFVPDNDYRKLIERSRPELLREGEFRDAAGQVVGKHVGVAGYTIGQRHGLGLALGKPVYVTKLDVLSNTVQVGPKEELESRGLIAERVNWLVDPPPAGATLRVQTKIRHMHTPAAATMVVRKSENVANGTNAPNGTAAAVAADEIELRFDDPQSAVTPGQAAVCFSDDTVICGGWIRAAQ